MEHHLTNQEIEEYAAHFKQEHLLDLKRTHYSATEHQRHRATEPRSHRATEPQSLQTLSTCSHRPMVPPSFCAPPTAEPLSFYASKRPRRDARSVNN